MLPADTLAKFQDLFAHTVIVPLGEAPTKEQEQRWPIMKEKLEAAMSAVGFAWADVAQSYQRPIPAPSTLSDLQREALALLSEHPEVPIRMYPCPGPAWAKRRWLGIDPPGALFRDDAQLYRAFRETEDSGRRAAMLDALTFGERIEALVDLTMLGSDYDGDTDVLNRLRTETAKIDASLGAWAQKMAPWLLAIREADYRDWECSDVRAEVLEAVFVALVRAGVRMDPNWETLLPLEHVAWDTEHVYECIDAIPKERREARLLDGLDRLPVYAWKHAVAVKLLKKYPYRSIARWVLARAKDAENPNKVIKALLDLGDDEIAALVKEHKAGQKPAPKLTVRSRGEVGKLDAVAKKQLEIAANRYDDEKHTAEEILANEDGDAGIMCSTIEVVRIDDAKKKPAFDAWLYMVDSGTIFRAGTTEVVAEVVQGSIECSDPALRAALADAIESKAKPKPAKKKATAKKKAASRARR